MYMPCRKPTRREINEGEVFDLTDYRVWNPKQDKTDDSEDHDMFPDKKNHCKTKTSPELPDMNQLKRCLGWKPDDVIIHTLKNTTQFASNLLRLPMKKLFKLRDHALYVKNLREAFVTDLSFQMRRPMVGTLVPNFMWVKRVLLLRFME